jgi:hypothetical protein
MALGESGQAGGTCICFKKEGEKMTADKTKGGELLPVWIQGRGNIPLLKHAWIKPNAIGGESPVSLSIPTHVRPRVHVIGLSKGDCRER